MKFAVLLSHLSRTLGGDDLPIAAVRTAIENLWTELSGSDEWLVSAGQPHWDLLFTTALEFAIPFRLILPRNVERKFISAQFAIADFTADFVDNEHLRDEQIIVQSEKIFPLWLRSRGRMAELLAAISFEKIDRRFQINGEIISRRKIVVPSPNPELEKIPSDYLWHWTRAPEYVFPDENRREFWRRKLVESETSRTAFTSLINILRTKKIYGSAKFIGGGDRVVAFTENHPQEMSALFKWIPGRARMNFEPYAIGIPTELARARGAEKIRYGEKSAWNAMAKSLRWESEREWRLRGDLIFDAEVCERLAVITCTSAEISIVKKLIGNQSQIVAWSAEK